MDMTLTTLNLSPLVEISSKPPPQPIIEKWHDLFIPQAQMGKWGNIWDKERSRNLEEPLSSHFKA